MRNLIDRSILVFMVIISLFIAHIVTEPEPTVVKQEPLLCGNPHNMSYLDEYIVDDIGFVRDTKHDRVYEYMMCKAYKGIADCNTALGRDCDEKR